MGAPIGATAYMTPASCEAVRRAWEQEEGARFEGAMLALSRMEAIMVEAYKQHRGGGPDVSSYVTL